MTTPQPIIAGIDFSDSSALVLRHAIHLAKLGNTRVIGVHVAEASRLSHRAASGGSNPVEDQLEKEAKRRFAAIAEANAGGVEIDFIVTTGRPAEELQKATTEHDARLLVIAANDLTKARLGTIASRCIRTVDCHVMILRDWQGGNFAKIVVCTDFSPTASRALEHAVGLAGRHGAELEVVHVMYPPSKDYWGEVLEHDEEAETSYTEERHAKVNEQMEQFLKPCKEQLGGLTVNKVILESTLVSTAMTLHIQDCGAELVVLGTASHSKLASYFIGTNAERLIADASVSVLAIRA